MDGAGRQGLPVSRGGESGARLTPNHSAPSWSTLRSESDTGNEAGVAREQGCHDKGHDAHELDKDVE